jgi:TPR repeat protein
MVRGGAVPSFLNIQSNKENILRAVILIAFITCFSTYTATPAKAADLSKTALEAAQQALAAGEYVQAYQQFLELSENHGLAQFSLGLMEQQGWGRAANPEMACRWFEKAAIKQVPAAQQFFGDCLAKGVGQQADGKAAVTWYKKAATSGIPYALCSAGHLYITAQGVEKNTQHGLDLCTAAAQAGSTPAMLRLADYFREGMDVPQNLKAARQWYQQAAEHHNRQAQYRLGLMLSEGLGGPPDIDQARFWLELAASQGCEEAYLPVAILYANAPLAPQTGMLSPENLAKVYMWNAAAKAVSTDLSQQHEIKKIEALALAVMPAEWKEDLDRRVAQHLSKYKKPL